MNGVSTPAYRLLLNMSETCLTCRVDAGQAELQCLANLSGPCLWTLEEAPEEGPGTHWSLWGLWSVRAVFDFVDHHHAFAFAAPPACSLGLLACKAQ